MPVTQQFQTPGEVRSQWSSKRIAHASATAGSVKIDMTRGNRQPWTRLLVMLRRTEE